MPHRFQRDFLAFLAAKVMKEEIGMIIVGNEDVYESVTIVVGDGRTHSFA